MKGIFRIYDYCRKFVSPLQQSIQSKSTMSTFVICKETDLTNGQMKELDVDKHGKILLVKDNNKFFALGAKCTHYGASLAKGAYCNGNVRCPWHGACFNIETGDIEDFPGFDSLPTFKVDVTPSGDVAVTLSPGDLDSSISISSTLTCPLKPNIDVEPVVIIGGGAAAASCVESLRKYGFKGPVTMLTAETCLPYDRPKLSKALGVNPDSIVLKKSDYYEKLGVNVVFGAEASKIDPENKVVHLSDGRKFVYGKAVVATGGRPRTLDVPGYCPDVKNVFYLRKPADGQLIGQHVADKDVVIVGSSFIGMELASVIAKKSPKSLTVVSNSRLPFEQVFGAQIGQAILKLFESHGVKFKLSVDVSKLNHNSDNEVTSLDLQSKVSGAETLPCQVCIVGIGVAPSTTLFEGSGATLDQRGYVEVDEHLGVVGLSNVYACGDIARFPLATFQHQMANIQHWQMALKHGKAVGQHIAGKATPLHTVPFFWTAFFGKSIRYTGYGAGYDEIIVHGDASQMTFVAHYLKNENLVAVATCGRDPIAARLAEYFRIGKVVTKSKILKNTEDLWP